MNAQMMHCYYILCESQMTQNVLWSRASVCLCVSAAVRPHHCTDPDVTWGVVEAAH